MHAGVGSILSMEDDMRHSKPRLQDVTIAAPLVDVKQVTGFVFFLVASPQCTTWHARDRTPGRGED